MYLNNKKYLIFPNGKKFAFTIFDDTDAATLENIRPIYNLLKELKIFTTKSVWVFHSQKESDNKIFPAHTLANPDYLTFIRELSESGFEIALHGVSSDSNPREKTILGIEQFKNLLGFYPTSYAGHLNNFENLYGGTDKLSSSMLRFLMRIYEKQKNFHFQGHIKNSPYFWGDICKKYIRYVRSFTFNEINILKINPTLPYYDPSKPFVNFWFSSADGSNVEKFNKLLSQHNQEQLEKEGGVCIVYTHFAFGFVKNSKVNPKTKKLLEELSRRNGYFVPVTKLLDHLRNQKNNLTISPYELKKMEWRWFFEKINEKIFRRILKWN